MKKPELKPGLVICYDYLWFDQTVEGRTQGGKDRPCATVVASREDENGDRTLLICPVTHTPPAQPTDGIAIPPKLARATGLDDRPSWIRTNEYNEVNWNDPGITPARKDQWEFGRMPEGLYRAMRESFLDHYKRKSLRRTDRSIED